MIKSLGLGKGIGATESGKVTSYNKTRSVHTYIVIDIFKVPVLLVLGTPYVMIEYLSVWWIWQTAKDISWRKFCSNQC